MFYESRNNAVLKNLHPTVAERARLALSDLASSKLEVLFTAGLRSMEEQARLYAQGRNGKGKIVTNARPGESYHNYGLAIDFVPCKGADLLWHVSFKPYAEVFKKYGFSWGGDWQKFKDYPHIEYTFGLTIKDLIAGKRPSNPVPLAQRFKDRGAARMAKQP